MLRARLPLAVALLAACLIVPATAASADTGTTNPVGGVTNSLPGSGAGTPQDGTTTQNSSTTQNDTTTPGSTTPGGTTPGGTTPAGSSGAGTNPLGTTNPLAGTPLAGLGSLIADPTQVPTDLQTLGTCLQGAGSDTTTGQKCVETFLGALGLPNTDCFSTNGFTVDAAVAAIKNAIAAGPSGLTPATFQANMAKYAAQLQGLVTCLTAVPSQSADTSTSGGGAAVAPTPDTTSGVAPAATPVTGTPNFTG